MIETILLILIITAAIVWATNYLYRLFRPAAKNNGGDCSPTRCEGCASGCDGIQNR